MRFLTGHNRTVTALAYTPDGQTLASASFDGSLRLWDTTSGVERHAPCFTRSPSCLAVAISPNGRRLAAGFRPITRNGENVGIWELTSNGLEPLDQWVAHAGDCRAVAFSPDGFALATGGSAPLAKIWDLHRWQLAETLTVDAEPLHALAFNPNERTLAAVGWASGTLYVWDRTRAYRLFRLRQQDQRGHALAFSRDGSAIAFARGETVVLWEPAVTPELIALSGHEAEVLSVAFAPDGQSLASAGADGLVKFWDRRTHVEKVSFNWELGELSCVAFAPDGLTIAIGGLAGQILIWDVEMDSW